MALDAQALVTEAEARAYLGVSASEDPPTPLIETLVNGLSRRIAQHTGRLYVNPATSDGSSARTFMLAGGNTVNIDSVRSVTKVEVSSAPNDAGSWVEWTGGYYVLEPIDEAVKEQLRFLSDPASIGVGWDALAWHQRSGTPWPDQEAARSSLRAWVRITGKFGLAGTSAAVPANVKLALLVWLQNLHKRDQAFFSDNAARVVAGIGMPKDTLELLSGESTVEAMIAAV